MSNEPVPYYTKNKENNMKPTKDLVNDLCQEHLMLTGKIARAQFALGTLSLDSNESTLLFEQIELMQGYADKLVQRAGYALKKENK